MSPAEQLVRVRLEQAEALLVGLAVPGTDAHTALLHLQAALDRGEAPDGPVLDAGLAAVTAQAGMSLRAGRSALAEVRPADQPPHWSTGTAHEWQRYLRWLVAILDRAAAVGAVPGEWDRAGSACARAREVWGAVAGTLTSPDPVRDDLESVLVDGRAYVRVDQLAGSLRTRAGAFAAAAASSARAGDELGALVSEEIARELSARADALDLAGIEQAGFEQAGEV